MQSLFSTTVALAKSSDIDDLFHADVPSVEWIHSSCPVHKQVTAVPLQGGELRSCAQTLRGWAADIPNKEALATMVAYLGNIGSTVAGTALLTPKQQSCKDI